MKAAAAAKPAAHNRENRAAAELGKKKARKMAGSAKAPIISAATITSIDAGLQEANGAPMAISEIVAITNSQELATLRLQTFRALCG